MGLNGIKMESKFSLKLVFLIIFIWHSNNVFSITPPEELGNVNWLRNFEEAKAIAAKTNKPIYMLFQEVPGCATCRNFGNNVLAHPLIVEMIETYYVPLAIYNNKSGHDADILKKYNEPAWNNPVSRIVDKNGKDLIPRLSGSYTEGAVITYLRKGIEADKKLIPKYIQLLEEEYTALKKEIVLEMYCFWSGEKNIAKTKGVIKTEPGFSNGREVVKVTYDESATNASAIITEASKTKNADAVHTNDKAMKDELTPEKIIVKNLSNFTLDKDIHYYLKNSIYSNIYMTPYQATKINSLIAENQNPDLYLSPRQMILLEKVKNKMALDSKRYLSLK
jgi:hypothetical protein